VTGAKAHEHQGWALPRICICGLIVRMLFWQSALRITLTFVLGLCFDWFSGSRWGSWPETFTTIAFVVLACVLAGMSVGGASRYPDARASVIAFALSFLVWPALHGMLRQFTELVFFGLLQVLPTLAGGVTGMVVRRSSPRAWWVIAAAVGSVSITAAGPPH